MNILPDSQQNLDNKKTFNLKLLWLLPLFLLIFLFVFVFVFPDNKKPKTLPKYFYRGTVRVIIENALSKRGVDISALPKSAETDLHVDTLPSYTETKKVPGNIWSYRVVAYVDGDVVVNTAGVNTISLRSVSGEYFNVDIGSETSFLLVAEQLKKRMETDDDKGGLLTLYNYCPQNETLCNHPEALGFLRQDDILTIYWYFEDSPDVVLDGGFLNGEYLAEYPKNIYASLLERSQNEH